MPDRRDRPFRTFSLGPSASAETGGTQAFRRFGAASRGDVTAQQFNAAAADIDAMTARFKVRTRQLAEQTLEILRDNVIKYIEHGQGDFRGYSMGRLAATIGRWDDTQFVNSEAAKASEEEAIRWAAANGVASYTKDDGDELTIIEMGAYSSVKRYRGDMWAVEMGTFTPYAGLVEDGGSMAIAAYGNPNSSHIAHWEANHMFKRGTFDSYNDVEKEMRNAVDEVLKG